MSEAQKTFEVKKMSQRGNQARACAANRPAADRAERGSTASLSLLQRPALRWALRDLWDGPAEPEPESIESEDEILELMKYEVDTPFTLVSSPAPPADWRPMTALGRVMSAG